MKTFHAIIVYDEHRAIVVVPKNRRDLPSRATNMVVVPTDVLPYAKVNVVPIKSRTPWNDPLVNWRHITITTEDFPGISVCHPKDNFSRKEGKTLASTPRGINLDSRIPHGPTMRTVYKAVHRFIAEVAKCSMQ